MRTAAPLTASSLTAPRRLLLAAALSVPLSGLLLGGAALAAPGETGSSPSARSSSGSADAPSAGRESAPGQQGQPDAAASSSAPAPRKAAQGTSAQGTSAQGTSAQGRSTQGTSAQGTSTQGRSTQGRSAQDQPARPADSKPAPSSKGTSGSTGSPQPLSKADRTGSGANPGGACTHAYCSTRDGSPSLNGNGDGTAGGKPCAGCVGKADNKNPAGQAPDGTDSNSGYECDGNNGIGRSNPAHTACVPAPDVLAAPPAAPKPCLPEDAAGPQAADCIKPTPPSHAAAPIGTDTAVLSDALTRPAPPVDVVVPLAAVAPQLLALAPRAAAPAQAAVAATTQVRPAALPFTGAELLWLLPVVLLTLTAGLALVRAGRRAAQAQV